MRATTEQEKISHTQFKHSTNTHTQCIRTHHVSTHHKDCNRDMMPVYAAGVIAVLAAVLGVVGFVVIRRRVGVGRGHPDWDKHFHGSEGDLVAPRHDYAEMVDVVNGGGQALYFQVGGAWCADPQQGFGESDEGFGESVEGFGESGGTGFEVVDEQQPHASSQFT